MAQLEDMINSVLNDPEQMNMISSLAQSLMGAEMPQEKSPAMELDAGMLGRIRRLMASSSDKPGDSEALLRAMQPYLSEKRRAKMDKALKLVRFAKLAGFAMEELGGEEK